MQLQTCSLDCCGLVRDSQDVGFEDEPFQPFDRCQLLLVRRDIRP